MFVGHGGVIRANNELAARERCSEFTEQWAKKCPAIMSIWECAWVAFVPFLQFDPEIRRIV